jgi:uncharacterized protein (DUF433 family)
MIGRFRFIEQVPGRCGGAPVIVGTRLTVETVAERAKFGGQERKTLLEEYPYIDDAIIDECLDWVRCGMPVKPPETVS